MYCCYCCGYCHFICRRRCFVVVVAGALGVDLGPFGGHWGIFLVPRGTILESFWCLGGSFGVTLGGVAVPLAPKAPE